MFQRLGPGFSLFGVLLIQAIAIARPIIIVISRVFLFMVFLSGSIVSLFVGLVFLLMWWTSRIGFEFGYDYYKA